MKRVKTLIAAAVLLAALSPLWIQLAALYSPILALSLYSIGMTAILAYALNLADKVKGL